MMCLQCGRNNSYQGYPTYSHFCSGYCIMIWIIDHNLNLDILQEILSDLKRFLNYNSRLG